MDAAPSSASCPQPAGRFEPVVNRSRCEAKGPCVPACPYSVLEIHPLTDTDKAGLGFLARLKVRAHGNRQAFAIHPEACRACGKCVEACPEKAITLRLRALT
ncbi:MAG: 4Fe-4S dicluster domain-containing protein [Fibrobacteres bacterium]|jgi:4Fe-4S ferredoxin|nr:4Fe-4S dicluster domain-containing protein [Fibrobacterota bacterium]